MREKFIKSTIILIIGGFLTKLLGMLIKIVMARLLGTEGLGMYMLVLPTFLLLINVSQFGLPIALSKLISEETRSSKKLFFSILPILIIINILIMIGVILAAPLISKELLHNENAYPSILAMALVIPFTSISSICRSYFFGKERMFPHVVSNIVEDLVRLLIMIIGIPFFLPFGLKYTVCFLILSNVISELASTLILIFFLPKNAQITKEDLKPNKTYIKESLHISIPNTTSRLIGSIGMFLEPIILTNTLLHVGYSMKEITTEYGILTGYVIPLILLPSFFTLAISQALLPTISKDYEQNNKKNVKRKIRIAITLSLIIGLPVTILLEIIPEFFLTVLYHTREGALYTKLLAPICLLQYIQSPLTSSLDAMGKSKDNMIISLLGTTTRTILLWGLSYLKIGIGSLLIATSMNIIITTLFQIKKVRTYLTLP